MKTRVRRGDPERERQWQAAVEQWRQSGQSVRDFCRAHELKEAAFYFWRRELGRRHPQAGIQAQNSRRPLVSGPPQADRAQFLPVRVIVPALEENRGGLEIALADGRVIRVRPGFDRQTLADILAVLEVRPC